MVADVVDASVCVVDRAECFGLSQLHQIRGRIGRGASPCNETLPECLCVLLTKRGPASQPRSKATIASHRLKLLTELSDCFSIAAHDLQMRGPGDIFGFRQHGQTNYRAVSMTEHSHLLNLARSVAHEIMLGSYKTSDGSLVSLADPRIQRILQLFSSQQQLKLATSEGTTTATTTTNAVAVDDEDGIEKSAVVEYGATSRACDEEIACLRAELMVETSLAAGITLPAVSEIQPSSSLLPSPSAATTSTTKSSSSSSSSSFQSTSPRNPLSSISFSAFANASNHIDFLHPWSEYMTAAAQVQKQQQRKQQQVLPALVIVLDLEATGLRIYEERIIQIAAKVMGSEESEIFNIYVLPEDKTISPMIHNLTGISQEFVDEHGVPFGDAWNQFVNWIARQRARVASAANSEHLPPVALLAHNGKGFDFPLLAAEYSRVASRRLLAARVQDSSTPAHDSGATAAAVSTGVADVTHCDDGSSNGNNIISSSITSNTDKSHQQSVPSWTAAAKIDTLVDTLVIFRDKSFWATAQTKDCTLQIPSSKSMANLYLHLFARPIQNAHDAVGDVEALEEILQVPSIRSAWRETAQRVQFVPLKDMQPRV